MPLQGVSHAGARGMSDCIQVALLVETSLASGRNILQGIARYLREHRPWSLYHEPQGLADAAPSWLRHWSGDGIIARVQSEAMAEEIRASGVPVVDVLGAAPDPLFPLVHVDNSAIGRMAAEHLLDRGLRNFGYFGIQGENWSQQRYAAFQRAVLGTDSDVSSCELPRHPLDTLSWQDLIGLVTKWVAALPKPAGVFVCSDQRGPLFLEACRRAGVSVPDEVAVIGVDNDEPLCEVCDPPLSSIQASHEMVGYRSAAVLDALMRGADAPTHPILVEPEQVVSRVSTNMLAVEDAGIAQALRLIQERAHEGLKVGDIARQVGLSRSVLQRRFRIHLRRSVHDEILNTKVRYARELLLKSTLPIAVVAQRAGFKHQEYLGMVLKQRLGKTPKAIRMSRR